MPPSDRPLTRDLTLLDVQASFGEPGVLCIRTEVRGCVTASWVPHDGVIRVVVRSSVVEAVEALVAEHLDAKGRAA